MKNALRNMIEVMRESDPSARFEVRLWDGDVLKYGAGENDFVLSFHTRNALSRIFGDGFLGFGECYMDKEIEIEGDFRRLFNMGHLSDFGDGALTLKEKVRFAWQFLRNQNTFRGSRRNIAHSYNLGNDFYQLFLDDSLCYSCAYFKTPDRTLEEAQSDKYEHICRKLQLKPGERMVDLGCGWGGLLIHAARYHDITGIGATLSQPQAEFANARIRDLGLEKRIQVLHQDYREVKGSFDKLASVGMLEHVGKKFIPQCMRQVADLLKPGGLGLIHAVGNDIPYPDDPWTMKYMFPGSHVPALEQVVRDLARARLVILDIENLRMHYALTLEHWLERYERHFEEVAARFDERFARQWRLYWMVSITSFSHGGNRLFQTLFSKGLSNDILQTRAHIECE